MSDLFDQLADKVIGVEGGYTNDPNDAGGETIWGITKATARENGYAGAMSAMTRDQAKAIYRAKYWIRAGLALLADISPRIAAELFDTGVNMGVGTAALFIQRALNVLNHGGRDYADVAQDGAVGPATAAALRAFMTVRGIAGEGVILTALNCLQGARYIDLAEEIPADKNFIYGWLANRVSLAA